MEIPSQNIGLDRDQIETVMQMHDLIVERYRQTNNPLRGAASAGNSPRPIGLLSPMPDHGGFALRTVAADHLVVTGKTSWGEVRQFSCSVVSVEQIERLKAFLDGINEECDQQGT